MSDQITLSSAKVDDLLFTRMRAEERLGGLFAYDVEFESQDADIDLSGLLGSSMTVTLRTQDGYERCFNGMVCEAEQTAVETTDGLVFARYRARLVPKPWLLGGMVDCRIFKNKSVTDIVKAVLQEVGFSDLKLKLSGNYDAREYCVQYREDGLNFIDRLLQQEGIYYYFTHTGNAHTMVLADGVGSHAVAGDFGKVPYLRASGSVLSRQATIFEWASLRGVDGAKCQLTDYDPLKPKASLLSSGSSGGHGADGITVFDYPGAHAETGLGKHYAQVRAEALSAARSRYVGGTGACGIEIGGLFTLSGHPRRELNQEYLVTAVSMQLEAPGHASGGDGGEAAFACRFEALESSQPYRSMATARKPSVAGLQTAIVTGSDTDEDIAVDEHGRVQVTFHWNTPDKANADCSCPVRVASPWAGKGWGAVSLPRVGQEVVVSFIEGDPDRPLIVGSVYNAVNVVPYGLPDNKTQSGIKSRSLQGGADDFNELRFEDKQGSEDFFIHAQKDMHEEVENDHVVTIDHDETVTVKNDQTLTVQHDRKHTVQNDDSLDVSQNGTTTVGQKFKLSAGSQIELVCGASSITLKSSGDIEIKGVNIAVSGDVGVKVEGQTQVNIKAGATMDIGAGASVKVHSDAMMDVEGSAMTTIKGAMLKAGGDAMTQVSGGIIMIG
jgi:type VI secretion system secreted protein VgrG